MVQSAQIDRDVTERVVRVVRDVMGRYGLRQVTVEPWNDHDGEPSLLVTVRYEAGQTPIDPKAMASLVTIVRDALWEMGESRFPYIRHDLPENQPVAGFR